MKEHENFLIFFKFYKKSSIFTITFNIIIEKPLRIFNKFFKSELLRLYDIRPYSRQT